jgi:multidrug efflux pump subunit AcrA (membrane-fusion protein)
LVKLPAGGASAPYTFDIGGRQDLFSDTLQTNQGWSVTNTPIVAGTATTGAWELADPEAELLAESLLREASVSRDQRAAVAQAMANLERAKTNLEIRTIRAPKKGTVLSVKIREGEFVPASILPNPLITLGEIETLHLRIDIDESEIPRFHPNAPAQASVRGRPDVKVKINYVRTEPLVIPKRSLTGTVIERVDTRVMQVIYAVDAKELGATVGQQVDVYIEDWLQKP